MNPWFGTLIAQQTAYRIRIQPTCGKRPAGDPRRPVGEPVRTRFLTFGYGLNGIYADLTLRSGWVACDDGKRLSYLSYTSCPDCSFHLAVGEPHRYDSLN